MIAIVTITTIKATRKEEGRPFLGQTLTNVVSNKVKRVVNFFQKFLQLDKGQYATKAFGK